MLSSFGERSRPSARAPAPTSAAKPEADEASPAPVGKLLRLTTAARVPMPAMSRRMSRQAETRPSPSGRGLPSSTSSSLASAGSKATSVSDHNASSVIEIEPTAGTFSVPAVFPQYLTRAMFDRARAPAACMALIGPGRRNRGVGTIRARRRALRRVRRRCSPVRARPSRSRNTCASPPCARRRG